MRHCTGPKSRFIRYIEPGAEEHMKGDKVAITRLSIRPPSSNSESLAADLVSRLNGIKEVGYQLQALGEYFPYLPSRVGHNPALDAALRCLLGAHQNILSWKSTSFDEDLKKYIYALSLIRRDLDRLQSRTPSETVCAAMMLSTYEVCLGSNYC
jgi:hypothetical protein